MDAATFTTSAATNEHLLDFDTVLPVNDIALGSLNTNAQPVKSMKRRLVPVDVELTMKAVEAITSLSHM